MLDALAVGNVVPSDIRLAARHLLKPTIELGLLDGPTGPFRYLGPDDIDTPAYRQLAFEAGTEAITLLRNVKPAGAPAPLLPLGKGTVAIIGPAANFTQELLANYHGWNTVRRCAATAQPPSYCLRSHLTRVDFVFQIVSGGQRSFAVDGASATIGQPSSRLGAGM